MVFLTMTPEEFGHTKEPHYEENAYWRQEFSIPPFHDLPTLSHSYDISDTRWQGDGSEPSNDVTRPCEYEIPLKLSSEDERFLGTIGPPASPLERVKTVDSIKSDTTQAAPGDMSPIVRLGRSVPLTSPLDYSTVLGHQEPGSVVTIKATNLVIAEAVPQTPEIKPINSPILAPSTAISAPMTISPTSPASTRLRHLIAYSPNILLCPGVYDGLSARIALHVGFPALYMTGAGTTASALGASDLGIAHLHDMKTNAEMIANLVPDQSPLIADMDTGYGGPLVIHRAVQQYARAGVSAFHIEDQVPEKRCGHLSGKEVVDTETYLKRIKACLYARAQVRSDIVIIARTDALQSRGYDECIDRLRRARDLGADMGILEGVPTHAMAAQAVSDLAPWPLCYNSVENGHSPLITAAEAQAMGYRVMIFSFAGIAPAYSAILETFTKLRNEGVTGTVVGPKRIFEVCGLKEEMEVDEASGGAAFKEGV